MVQMGRKAIEPPGDAKEDLWIIQKLARAGLNWNYRGQTVVLKRFMTKCLCYERLYLGNHMEKTDGGKV